MRRTSGHPILPAELFSRLYDIGGGDFATEILDQVQEGSMTVEQVRKSLDRPDIDPEDWRDFEDGWRPDGW